MIKVKKRKNPELKFKNKLEKFWDLFSKEVRIIFKDNSWINNNDLPLNKSLFIFKVDNGEPLLGFTKIVTRRNNKIEVPLFDYETKLAWTDRIILLSHQVRLTPDEIDYLLQYLFEGKK